MRRRLFGGLAIAVLLTAGGLGTGVYFLVQAGGDEDASQVQATATAEAGQLSPPQDVIVAPIPTPTFPPAPTPPDIDTSDWLTYTSPLGFTIKYPPGWLPESTDIEALAQGRVKIFNEKAQEGRAQRLAVGELSGGGSGEAWIEMRPDAFPRFDVDELFKLCRPEDPRILDPDPPQEPSEVIIAGRPAVRCLGGGPSPNGRNQISGEGYYVLLPSGSVVYIVGLAVDGGDTEFELLQAILASVSFDS